MSSKRIAIVGAGSSGIGAFRACREQGLQALCYEKLDNISGLWRFREEEVEGSASIYRSTTINTSKEMTPFSDYPIPKDYPNYMHNTTMTKYIESYADRIGFRNCVKLRHRVVRCVPNEDHELTGKWLLTIENLEDSTVFDEVFDGVMLCTGHNNKPAMPVFEGQHLFRGKIVHSHGYKDTVGFEGKRVVVVGIGNSAGDIVCELTNVTPQVYMSTRTGSWVWHKIGRQGRPFDTMLSRRCWNILFKNLPYWLICYLGESYLNNRFDHKLYGLLPAHRLFSQHVFVNDDLPKKIASHHVLVRGNISRFTENGVVFEGEDKETLVDAVVMATGYEASYPMLEGSGVPISQNRDEFLLYKSVFCPTLTHPQTLAFIGFIQPTGAVLPLAELQSRWFALLMAGKLSLPAREDMLDQIDQRKQFLKERYPDWQKHALAYFWVSYMEDLAGTIGVKPNLIKYFFTDPKLWFRLYFGPLVPSHYRLDGPNTWSGAREAVLKVDERIEAPFKTSRNTNFNVAKPFFPLDTIKMYFKRMVLVYFFIALILVIF